jgi:hypothetical protein
MDLNLNPDPDPEQFPVLAGEKELTHDIGNCHHHRLIGKTSEQVSNSPIILVTVITTEMSTTREQAKSIRKAKVMRKTIPNITSIFLNISSKLFKLHSDKLV